MQVYMEFGFLTIVIIIILIIYFLIQAYQSYKMKDTQKYFQTTGEEIDPLCQCDSRAPIFKYYGPNRYNDWFCWRDKRDIGKLSGKLGTDMKTTCPFEAGNFQIRY